MGHAPEGLKWERGRSVAAVALEMSEREGTVGAGGGEEGRNENRGTYQ